ncbi:MAG: serine--tRNA ligase [Acidimicrobiales bacterium]|nr:MAG: serine--tRNA ligase [Acidimicrobiales bacterium]
MLDPKQVRDRFDEVAAALARRGEATDSLQRVCELEERRRRVVAERDELRSRVKALSRLVAEAMSKADHARVEELREESKQLGDRERELSREVDGLEGTLREHLLRIPNLPSPEAPDGEGPEDNVVVRTVGWDPHGLEDHQRVPHWEIGERLGILDMARASKLAGSMWSMFRREGAQLARALCQLCLDRNRDLYEEIRPPTMVRTEVMVGTGHLPKFADEAYHIERDDLWAIPTAEVPLTSLYSGEILDESELPLRLMALTACFRREAGAAGRDTRGLLRVHEFDKVELLAYATPSQAPEIHREILSRAEALIADLGLAYRVVDLCAGDLGASAARTFDVEVYAPGVDRWLECSSVSWFTDYQARRANLRYRTQGGGTAFVHTLNGSGLAVPRVWAALVETYHQPDGTVRIPDLLVPYMGGLERIEGKA